MNDRNARANIESVDLTTYPVDAAAVKKIPKQIAERYTVLAVHIEGSQLTVATCDPGDLYALEDIRLITNMRLRLVLCDKQDISHAIALHYSELDARTAASRAGDHGNPVEEYLQEMLMPSEEIGAPIVRLLNSLLLKAYTTNVSDIHLEPYEHETVIRMRRDGVLRHYMTLPLSSHRGLTARTKILAHMDIAEKRKPQDGHFKICLHEQEMHIRVSFVPTVYGEKGVLRFLTSHIQIDHRDSFGMSAENYARMKRMLKHPHGIIYFTGPTGSGKTTTLYSILEYLSQRPVNIVTIEDPVERTIPKLNQIQVHERAGVTFSSALRSVLRQDPDIIMVGETRDLETASTSVRAAITGHLVFSTLHTNDAASAAVRLLDMGVPDYMIAASLTGVVAQRLVRKVCMNCRGKGCHLCDGTGYRGRIAIHEILEIDGDLRKCLTDSKMVYELSDYVGHIKGFSTLKDELEKLVRAGITDMREMETVTYGLT